MAMSPDVIDLVSSSPPRHSPPSPERVAEAGNSSRHADNSPAMADAEPLLPWSDLSDLSDLDLFQSRRKRLKTSPEPQPAAAAASSVAPRPPLVLAAGAPLRPRPHDPIQVSSSMEPPPPNKSQPSESDPFASSPDARGATGIRAAPSARRAISLGPPVGSSSPVAVTGMPPRPLEARKQALPFAGSCSVAHPDQRRAPSPSGLVASRGTHQPDAICIDSSSSDDGDLPDIRDLEVCRLPWKPRSPLQRSRSDTTSFRSKPDPSRAADNKRKRAVEAAAAKERKLREREQAKEAKAKAKAHAAALAEANKLRTDKKVSTPEMIVNLPSNLGAEHRDHLDVLLTELGVDRLTWESPVRGLVKWRRKVTCRFDLELGRWEPVAPRIEDERHALAIVTADELIEAMINGELDSHAVSVKELFAGHQIIYLIQGMTPWLRKNRNLRNRQFTSGVRAAQAAGPAQRRQTRHEVTEYVPEDQVEDALLRLQLAFDVLIHHTTTAAETARWIVTFTQHISTIPYRKQKDLATSTAGFCMESGQVRTGDGPGDTYVKMLQEIARVTAPIAYGVANEFESVGQLVRGLDQAGPGRLEAVRKSANKDGQLSDRVIGQAVSRRLFKVFTGRDEASTDV